MKLRPCGDRATLLDCTDGTEARGWHASLRATADVTLGAKTVLVRLPMDATQRLIDQSPPTAPAGTTSGRTLTIGVNYDGPDLADVAEQTGLSDAEIVAAHTGTSWTVAFAGFAPGFAYLTGGDPRLIVARRDAPRALVPAGSVALAGGYSGIYPRPSPGGWQLIGRTDAPLWDLDRAEPALLRLGDVVQFEAAG